MPTVKQTHASEPRAAIRRFEDLVAWQKARLLAKEIYPVTRAGAFARDSGLGWQLQRAVVSVMANIAEGSERMHPKEFHQILATAKASCAEVRSHLYVAFDFGYLDTPTFERLMSLASETARVIGGLRAAVARRI